MKSLWFVMPVHGRENLTRICLRQLGRTCGELTRAGLEATAVIVGDDKNLDMAESLGFATVRRDNRFLARKFNDGIQLALDPGINPHPADYVVPIGSDDWVDHRIFHRLPNSGTVMGFRNLSFVSEDGRTLSETRLDYEGGAGIRIYPRRLMEASEYRPADEDRKRACDTSILWNTRRNYNRKFGQDIRVVYGDQHPHQIVDWKSPGEQLNTFDQVTTRHRGSGTHDPFDVLTDTYPADLLTEMRCHYRR